MQPTLIKWSTNELDHAAGLKYSTLRRAGSEQIFEFPRNSRTRPLRTYDAPEIQLPYSAHTHTHTTVVDTVPESMVKTDANYQ